MTFSGLVLVISFCVLIEGLNSALDDLLLICFGNNSKIITEDIIKSQEFNQILFKEDKEQTEVLCLN
jgi:hypothetical protein